MAVSTETDVALQMEIFLKVPRISPSEYLPKLAFFFFFLRHNGLFLPNESAWRLSEIFQLSAESSRQNKHSTELLFNLATAMSYSLQPQLSSQRLIVANFSLVSILVLTYRDHTVQYYISLQVSTPASPASAMLHGISVLVS